MLIQRQRLWLPSGTERLNVADCLVRFEFFAFKQPQENLLFRQDLLANLCLDLVKEKLRVWYFLRRCFYKVKF